jgi:hypothetical protein
VISITQPPIFESEEFGTGLSADDIRSARLDRCPWSGEIHDELRLAVAMQALRSVAHEQVASSACKALCEAAIDVITGSKKGADHG